MSTERGLGRVVAEYRQRRGLSRSELAVAAGLSYPYVSQIETGQRKPSRKAAASLAAALGLTTWELEAAIPRDEDDPRSRLESAEYRQKLMDGLRPVRAIYAPPLDAVIDDLSRPRSRSVGREEIIETMLNLLDEFDVDQRLDVLAQVQRRALDRLLEQQRGDLP